MILFILLVHASRIGKILEDPATFGARVENSAVDLVKPERIADSSTPPAGLARLLRASRPRHAWELSRESPGALKSSVCGSSV